MRAKILARGGAVAAALSLCSGLLILASTSASAAPACTVDYRINQWDTGFTADVTLKNLGDAISEGWTLEWDFVGNQKVTNGWSATYTQSGQHVSAKNPEWTPGLPTGGSASFGFNASYSGSNTAPTSFTLNGTVCNGGPTTTTTTTTTTTGTTTTTTTTTTTGTTTTTTTGNPGEHVANPYSGAKGYLNPDYVANVNSLADSTGGTLGTAMRKVAQNSTAVWMDRIGAITSGRGLTGHLDEAVRQASGGTPVVIQVVIYDLPNRDCAALASNGELQVGQNGLARYKTEYIDPIAAILANSKYRDLRIVAIVEPDSLPNLVTNLGKSKCAEASSSGAYVQGIQYALNKLAAIPNVYNYLDIAHSGWLGWSSNMGPAVQLIANTVKGTIKGVNSVDGFVSNLANYTPTDEVNLPDPTYNVGGQPLQAAPYYQYNPHFDEADYSTEMRARFVSAGFSSGIGMLIDTSRNGWGGANRPSGAGGSSAEAYVNSGRIDRRLHRGNWCNQSGAGIGARPTAAPRTGFDAYVWIKPPGESDGIATKTDGPNEEGKQHDPMCDPSYRGDNQANGGNLTGALANAPHAGSWFPAGFTALVQNAYPAL
ncbi:cellulose 1,4-beta-cellobiosidase [Saccharothrix carnea]|uniref:Glucanase n=1 Tax=Saccharothrix carnea TaxID=1280637 RepID=A0A2P8I1Z5_SACCR|nr:glycoside hydrolase family 6 protein [Saccharothrix carnea]PSL52475.1 cellulose 1,4-beta-cellobiosidase [Saccharothrix carnea]